MWYAVYEEEDGSGDRFVMEVDAGVTPPIHVIFDGVITAERISIPFEAASLNDAANDAEQYCFL